MTLKKYEITLRLVQTTVKEIKQTIECDDKEIILLAQVHHFKYEEIP